MTSDTLTMLDGSDATLDAYEGRALLIVNVASQCGFTRQYAGLEALYERYHERGLTVIGVPSNQFGAQEPGTAEEIAEFCQANFGVTFPLLATGKAGDVTWNFEKFLVSPQGDVVGRFRSKVEPEDPELVAAIEAVLPR
jgi:glutathione peroxidase